MGFGGGDELVWNETRDTKNLVMKILTVFFFSEMEGDETEKQDFVTHRHSHH